MKLPLSISPEHIKQQYNLEKKAKNGYVYVEIWQSIYVSEHKPLGRKTYNQGDENSSTVEFILINQRWIDNLPKMTVKNWQAQVWNF